MPSNPFYYRFKSAIALVLVTCTLSACTSGLLVRNLDWLVESYVNDYFDLRDAQSELLSELLDDSMRRSSANSIPAVLALLDQIIKLNADADLHSAVPNLAKSFEALGDRLAEDNTGNLVQFALTVSAAQREQIAEEIQQKNRKYAKKHVKPGQAARRKAFEKDVRASAKRWLGRLSSEQEAHLQHYVDQYRLNEPEWLASRESWQTEFLNALAMPAGVLKEQRLQSLIDDPEAAFTELERANSQFNKELSIQLLAPVLELSSDKQRARIEKQLLKLRKRISGFQQALGYSSERPDQDAAIPAL